MKFALIAAFLLFSLTSQGAVVPHLSPIEREDLRYRLQNLYNEADLTIRNQKVDASDLKRQERDFEGLKVFERIPFREDIPGLKRELQEGCHTHRIKLEQFHITSRSGPARPLPSRVYTDSKSIPLPESQIAGTIRFTLVLRGEEENVKKWARSLVDEQMRLVVPDGDAVSPAMRHLHDGRWQYRGQAFHFRKIRFPTLVARDPMELLPAWARRNPRQFAAQEPRLWEFVTRIRELEPQAQPLLSGRGEFLLGSERMSFFISKAVHRP